MGLREFVLLKVVGKGSFGKVMQVGAALELGGTRLTLAHARVVAPPPS